MELHHQVNSLDYSMVHVRESAGDLLNIAASKKAGIRVRLKNSRAALESDILAFDTQKHSVVSLMAGLRECDIEFDDALRAFEEVSAAVLTGLRRCQSSNDDVTSELSVASTPVDDSDDNKSAGEQIPEELQDFYDAVMQVRFMQERLVDLNAERDEQIVRRDLLIDQEVDLDQTDEEFNKSWVAELSVAQGNLDEAETALQSAYAACKEANITIPVLQSEGAPGHPENLHSEQYIEEEHSSAASIESELAASGSPLPITPRGDTQAGNKIAQWVASLEQNPTTVSHLGAHTARSEPGGVISDHKKASAIRALNSDLYAQQSSHFNLVERKDTSPSHKSPWRDQALSATGLTSASLAEPSVSQADSMASREQTSTGQRIALSVVESIGGLPASTLPTDELLQDDTHSKKGGARTSDEFSGDAPVYHKSDPQCSQVDALAIDSGGPGAEDHTRAVGPSGGSLLQERKYLTSAPSVLREQSERDDFVSSRDTDDMFFKEMSDLDYEVISPFMTEETFHESLKTRNHANNLKATTVDSGLGSSIFTAFDAGLYAQCTSATFFG